MMFADRREAGERLAQALSRFADRDLVVLAIPRGGVVVGDGVATGGTAAAAAKWAKKAGAARVVLAVPVAPPQAAGLLAKDADEVVILATPEPFYAVGQWYEFFDQVSDEEVVSILEAARKGTAEGRG